MPPRLYCPLPLAPAHEVSLPEAAAHHVRHVLRLRVGEAVVLFNGDGGEYEAGISRIDRQVVLARTGAHRATERESPVAITLAQGIARADRMDYAIQKAVELGVWRVAPLMTARCTVRLDEARAARRHAHWHGIVVHACEQCGRNRLPELTPVQPLAAFAEADSAPLRVTLDPRAATTLCELVRDQAQVTLAVGPEGGFTPDERALLEARGYVGARLGPRVLRTETGALVALAVIQSRIGDLR